MTIEEFLTARYDEIEWWAVEASRCGSRGYTPRGEHWRWECHDDHQINPDPLVDSDLHCTEDENYSVSLRSVEEYPYDNIPGEGPHFALNYVEEAETVVAGHIIRHDPAAVLADLAAKRQIFAECSIVLGKEGNPMGERVIAWQVMRLLASAHRDHPDWREAWQ